MEKRKRRTSSGKKKEPSLVAVRAGQVREWLDTYFPNNDFRVRAIRYSPGGEVRVSWMDGLREEAVKNVLEQFTREHGESIIHLVTQRSFSATFVTAVAQAYCRCMKYPLPEITVLADGTAQVSPMYQGNVELHHEILRWCMRIDERSSKDLAFVYNRAYNMVEQSSIVLKKDFSAGRYPEKAIIAIENSWKISYEFSHYDITEVVQRLGPHRVKVVHRGGLGHWYRTLWEALEALDSLVQTGSTMTFWRQRMQHRFERTFPDVTQGSAAGGSDEEVAASRLHGDSQEAAEG